MNRAFFDRHMDDAFYGQYAEEQSADLHIGYGEAAFRARAACRPGSLGAQAWVAMVAEQTANIVDHKLFRAMRCPVWARRSRHHHGRSSWARALGHPPALPVVDHMPSYITVPEPGRLARPGIQ